MIEEEERFSEIFKEEAVEILFALEASLLELEKEPDNKEVVSCIFRKLHTIKGSGGMAGFDEVSRFTHAIETVYDMVRNGQIAADKNLIDLTLSASDLLRKMITAPQAVDRQDEDRKVDIQSSFMSLIPGFPKVAEPVKASAAEDDNPSLSDPQGRQTTYRIHFRPARDILLKGTNPILLLNELRRIGKCSVVAHTDDIPDLNELNPEACYTYWDMILATTQGLDAIRDVFIFVEDECELRIDAAGDVEVLSDELDHRKMGETPPEKGETPRENDDEGNAIGRLAADEGPAHPVGAEAALAEREHGGRTREERPKCEIIQHMKVSSRKLDMLVDLVGELVTVQARLSRTAALREDPELLSISEEVERLTSGLREGAMSIRMLPIGTTFDKFKRIVRDLAGELGKDVELTSEGAETELDKTVIEQLSDPLVHLIRNSIDHGIETPEQREEAGKPRKGTVRLSAMHSGPNVLIQIRDDGRGIDPDIIRAKAVEKGLAAPEAELSEKDILSLMLLPGLSTASNVTSVSGRGVGLDVVKKAVDSLRGGIDISSRKGFGTTITLILPLTLAIIEGLLVTIGKEFFVLPLSVVQECVELTLKDRKAFHGRSLANVRGQIVPYVSLREHFMIGGERPEREQIVIISSEGRRIGFVVDEVIGENQTVIKALGRVFKDIEGISGATILGDGVVALIADVPKLVKAAEYEEVSNLTAAAVNRGEGFPEKGKWS